MFLCCHTCKGLEPVAVMCGTFLDGPFFHLVCYYIRNFHRQFFALFYGFFQFFVDFLRKSCLHDGIIKHVTSKSLYYIDILTHFISPFYLLTGKFQLIWFPHFLYFSDTDSVLRGSFQSLSVYDCRRIHRPESMVPVLLR